MALQFRCEHEGTVARSQFRPMHEHKIWLHVHARSRSSRGAGVLLKIGKLAFEEGHLRDLLPYLSCR